MENDVKAVESAIDDVQEAVVEAAQTATELPAGAAKEVTYATTEALDAATSALTGLSDRVAALEGTIGKTAIETEHAIETPANEVVEEVSEPAPVPNAAVEKSLLRKVHDAIG